MRQLYRTSVVADFHSPIYSYYEHLLPVFFSSGCSFQVPEGRFNPFYCSEKNILHQFQAVAQKILPGQGFQFGLQYEIVVTVGFSLFHFFLEEKKLGAAGVAQTPQVPDFDRSIDTSWQKLVLKSRKS